MYDLPLLFCCAHDMELLLELTSLRLTFVNSCILDYSKGFGGKYGVQKDRMDKVCMCPYVFYVRNDAFAYYRAAPVAGLYHLQNRHGFIFFIDFL